MKIEFKKIGSKPKSFKIEKDSVEFSGEFKKESNSLVDVLGKIKNDLKVLCDRCNKEFMLKLDENIHIKISDGIYKGNIEDFDVIEFYEGFIDFDEILSSELESIKLDYHLCEECKKEEDFEKEF